MFLACRFGRRCARGEGRLARELSRIGHLREDLARQARLGELDLAGDRWQLVCGDHRLRRRGRRSGRLGDYRWLRDGPGGALSLWPSCERRPCVPSQLASWMKHLIPHDRVDDGRIEQIESPPHTLEQRLGREVIQHARYATRSLVEAQLGGPDVNRRRGAPATFRRWTEVGPSIADLEWLEVELGADPLGQRAVRNGGSAELAAPADRSARRISGCGRRAGNSSAGGSPRTSLVRGSGGPRRRSGARLVPRRRAAEAARESAGAGR